MSAVGALLPLFLGVPILAAALAVLVPWAAVRRGLVYGVPLAGLVAGLALISYHETERVAAVNVGDFVPGVSIPFASDTFSALMISVCSLVALLAVWLSDASGDLAPSRYFPALVLLLLGGVGGALLTADAFNLFVMVEVMLMPSYALLALAGRGGRIAAGRTFVVVNLLTSTLLLAGVGLVYAVAGTTNLAALAGAAREDSRLALALGIVVLALCIKSSAVPVHGWLPSTYAETSPGVMALFAGLHTKVALYAIIRIWSTAFDFDPTWGWLMLTAALATTLVGSIGSAAGSRIRGVLSWQMIAGVGVILAALSVGVTRVPGENGPQLATTVVGAALTAAIAYMIHHMITMGGLISAFGALEKTYGSTRLTGRGSLSGMWWRERPVAILVAVGIASLVGFPLTSGLVAKFEVVRAAALAGGAPGLATLFVVCAGWLIGLLAMLRLWRNVMWDSGSGSGSGSAGRPRTALASRRSLVPLVLTAPAAILMACSVAMFVFYEPLAKVTDRAAISLIDTRGYIEEVLGPGSLDGQYMVPPLSDGEFRPLAGDDAREAMFRGGNR
ncbi:proton-conducting transporter transmembrane domain-containing protein [Dietzia sp.]|uniref:proton-conducting transporter transmembrane domain-containing protein n=1 Tax=Dietzia sp. TaxID=1871616 RepID=UPI002FD88ECF